jgi:2-polyprenyl-6-methoxyphenol hydroxylase-like FAD-dependent oxidoreductase
LQVAIAGYGTAGQAAAALLAADGHRLEVFERAPVLGPVGAGLLLQPTGLWVLWQMGLLDQAFAHGAVVRRLYGDTVAGRAVMDMRYAGLDVRMAGLGMQRGALFEILAGAWDQHDQVRCGHEIVDVSEDGRRLTDAAGRVHGPYDLVILADGSASRLREQVGPARLNRPYPWGALWCLLPQGDWPWADELRQRYRGAERMMGLLPVGTRAGDPVRRLSFFWSLPTATVGQWREHGLAAWKAEAAGLWPQAAGLLEHLVEAGQLAPVAYRDAILERWHRPSLAVIGDAAHAMSPQLGQGVNMALLDAMALRKALRDQADVAAALGHFERERRRHVAIYQFWSRWLTPLFQSQRQFPARLRDLSFAPLSRMPIGRGQMLRVLTGTQQGWFGRLKLPEDFLVALAAAVEQA